ncbi:MAG: hypothetical protein NTY65_04925 [Planctomycetota bacterium]|nr:hypothetical protein [Planctomycetota bacterium]
MLAVGWGIASARAADVGASDPAPAEPPATTEQPPATTAQPSPQELAARKIEKLLYAVRDKMSSLQNDEFQIEMASIQSQGTALQAVKNPKNATEQIAKNAMTPELKAYHDTVLASACAWQELQQRYFAIGRTIKTLERDKPNAPADLQADIDACAAKFKMKNRLMQMKVASLYETAADYKSAMAILTAVYQEIPEEKRAGEWGLTVKIGDLCAKAGDLKTALDMYKKALATIGDAKPDKGGKGGKGGKNAGAAAVQKKIDAIEKKLGAATPAVPASAPAAAKSPAKAPAK